MKNYLAYKLCCFLLVALINGCGSDRLVDDEKDHTQTFPIANRVSDFGSNTLGGSGGQVIRVTTLEADGPGSLNQALATSGPRIIVFEVAGVIDLGKQRLNIREPFVTVAGQTAPSPGITIIRGGILIQTHDVIVTHIRVRPGDAGETKGSGWEPDGISTAGGAHDVLIDHCSVSWGVDENMSASGPRTEGPEATSHRITFRHCIIAEGLHDASHAEGPHSKGSLIHDFCREIAVVGNLYAHNVQRNPYFKAFTTGVIVNNVIYNPGNQAVHVRYSDSEWAGTGISPQNAQISVVGNVLIHGANTRQGLALVSSVGDVYLEDNLAWDQNGNAAPLISGDIAVLEDKPIWGDAFVPLPSSDVVEQVIQKAGARPRDRDVVDLRIINDFLARQGQVINSQDDVGGYPQVEKVVRPLTVPANVDAWLVDLAASVE